MKKRLLSAALALAMVLTMLPLTVFATDPTPGDTPSVTGALSVDGVTVQYVRKDNQVLGAATIEGTKYDAVKAAADGWYVTGVQKDIPGSTARSIYFVNGGVIAGSSATSGGQWYSSVADAVRAKKTQVVLAGNDSSTLNADLLNPNYITSLTIELNGHAFNGSITVSDVYTNSSGSSVANTFSSLTIKDTSAGKYLGVSDSNWAGNPSGFSIDVGGSGSEKASAVAITLTNVKNTGNITAHTKVANNVTLTNSANGDITLTSTAALGTVKVEGSTAGAITMTGVSSGAVNVGSESTSGTTGAISITTTGTTTGGKVTAKNATITGVTLRGVGANLDANSSTVDDVKLFGHDGTGLTDSQKSSLANPSVKLQASKATGIADASGTNALTKELSVQLLGNSDGGAVSLANASVTITNSKTSSVTLKNGVLNVSGSTTGPASTGALTLGDTNKAVKFTVTGTNVTTDNIGITGTVNITTPAGDTNTFGAVSGSAIANRGISGGVWGSEIKAENLVTTLRYQVQRNTDKFVYYSSTQFQQLIDEYAKYSNGGNFGITVVQDNAQSKSGTITFKNGDETLTEIKYGTSSMNITLPTTVNGGAVSKWTEYDENDKVVSEPATSVGYSTPRFTGNTAPNRTLNAQVTDNTITKLTDVSSNVDGVTARLNGSVITLSGALPSDNIEIKIEVTTDGKPQIKEPVYISYADGKVWFANQNASLGGGMRISADYSTLTMPNGTNSYTLDGKGLKVQASNLSATQVIGYTQDSPVIVTVTANNPGWTSVSKTALADLITNDVLETQGDTLGVDKSDKSYVNFSKSPAVKEALNAIVSGITESQVNSWLLAAQNAAWRKGEKTNTAPTEAQRLQTGYDKVYVVAYMAVNITTYNTANTVGAMTMTLTPSYYVEVRQSSEIPKYKLDASVRNELSVMRPRSDTLGNLTGDAGTIELVLNLAGTSTINAFGVTGAVAHQGNTYAYPQGWAPKAASGSGSSGGGAGGKVGGLNTVASLGQVVAVEPRAGANLLTLNITHTINNSLGSFVVNDAAPMVRLYETKVKAGEENGSNAAGYYDTLQAAVDDTTKDDEYIVVDANYDGSLQANMSGPARTIFVQTDGKNRVSSSNATGSVLTEEGGGTVFELQMKADATTTTPTTATISTQNAANGTARANVSSAKAGDRVTITTTAYNGYQAQTPIVRTNTNATVPVAAVGNTSSTTAQWTFTVPAGATSITITPAFTQSIIPFTDVRSDAWYFNGVAYCYNTTAPNGSSLMVGESSSIFAPERPVKRAEVAVLLYRLGNGSVETPKLNFTDVSTGYYAYNAIVWCYNHGYVRGYGDGTFKPEQYVTRQELAQMLYNYAGSRVNYNLSNNYTDGSNVPAYHADAMSWAAYYNVLSGTNSVNMSGSLDNSGSALRGQVAVTLMKFHQRYVR